MKKIKKSAVIMAAVIAGSMAVTAMAAPVFSKAKTIGAQKAKEIALAHAKLTAVDVTFEKAKLEYENRTAVYDVEFYSNGTEYEYEINAVDGKIREVNKEIKKTQPTVNQVGKITSEKAKEIALNHAGLKVQDVRFEKVKLDTEDGISVYEVEFKHNGMEYNYEINAASGTILESEVDND